MCGGWQRVSTQPPIELKRRLPGIDSDSISALCNEGRVCRVSAVGVLLAGHRVTAWRLPTHCGGTRADAVLAADGMRGAPGMPIERAASVPLDVFAAFGG